MPRLSLYRQNKTNDFKFFDNIIREQYIVGGIDIFIHQYLGPQVPEGEEIPEDNILKIEDLLFLENRNREYADNIHIQRGIYNVVDLDFDLSQFGLFVAGDTLHITFHYNDMIDTIGRKLMNGDVLEIPNLKDYNPLNPLVPQAMPKFYVVQEGSFAADGFSQTWLPHLWRVKCVPLKGGQEYKDILGKCLSENDKGIDGTPDGGDDCCTLGDLICQHNKNQAINDANLFEAHKDVPMSGYDNEMFYVLGDGAETVGVVPLTVDNTYITVDSTVTLVDANITDSSVSAVVDGVVQGYLTGSDNAPNGQPVERGISFPPDPVDGKFVLRVDYIPNRLFQFNGDMWVMIQDNVRTDLYLGHNTETQRNSFVNNDETVQTNDRGVIPSRQSLSKILRPEEDN